VQAHAIVINQPKKVQLTQLQIDELSQGDVVVEMEYSGVSTGTEKLIWSGTMPKFPGMGYPLVPGYESVGRITHASEDSSLKEGQLVFVPGAKCYGEVKGLFGGASSHVVIPHQRLTAINDELGKDGILLALAATAYHVTEGKENAQPDLIIGHGVVGRLLARIAVAKGKTPVVWEVNPARMSGAENYKVVHPKDDDFNQYGMICDASGDAGLINTLVSRLRMHGEIVLAGFYDQQISYMFAPAFMREMKMRIAAQWQPKDIEEVHQLIQSKQLSLHGLITHTSNPQDADSAYQTAFNDTQCLKMTLDWRTA
jgi:3-hydroxyethyl bacteriochlorophyllide a dehydrogenase